MSDRAVPALEEEIDYEGLSANTPLHINMIAGSLAGISEHAVMFPVDVIRTRMQVLSTGTAETYTVSYRLSTALAAWKVLVRFGVA